MQHPRGFTLVELLVVIAVIGILASIAIVSYIGVSDRAKTEKAAANTLSVRKVAESYFQRHNTYPTTIEDFHSAHTTLPSDVKILRAGESYTSGGSLTPLTADAIEKTVTYKYVNTFVAGVPHATGACFYHWDFDEDGRSDPIYIGSADPSNCHHSSSLGISIPPDP